MAFEQLMSPGRIGDLQVRNRIFMAPMGSNLAETDGRCGERIQAYYEARARGGAGLLILETSTVAWPAGATSQNMVGLSEERFLPELQRLTARVHRHGCRIAAQLNHAGKVAQADVAAGRPLLVPSAPPKFRSDMFDILTAGELANFVAAAGPDGRGPRYREMTRQDIDWLIGKFADAAALASRAGFDAVEIHAGHGYVLASFLSPAVNTRDDDYGGSRANRARLLCEVIAAVRERVGPGFPILVRLDAFEFRIDSGIQLEDAVVTAGLAEAAGASAVDVSAYGHAGKGIAFTEAPLVHRPGGFLEFARRIKAAVSIPVIAVGRIEPEAAERGLAAGDFDFVAMGRKLLADPDLPEKIASDRVAAIRPCIYCYVCVSRIFINQPLVCAVNPATGREHEFEPTAPVAAPRKVLVVGGGPAGLEAARVLALRGHRVTLWEREAELGGTARIAALPYEPNGRLVRHLVDEVVALPIEVKTGREASADNIRRLGPDCVLVATGARRCAPELPGGDQRHVIDGSQLRAMLVGGTQPDAANAGAILRPLLGLARKLGVTRTIDTVRTLSKYWMPLPTDIAIVGGDLVGLELAEFLVQRGRRVTVLEPSPNLGAHLSIVRRARLLHELREAGVQLHRGISIDRIGAASVAFTDAQGAAQECPARQVIIALGAVPDTSLADALVAAGIEARAIGDCSEVAYIEGAILSARRAALDIQ